MTIEDFHKYFALSTICKVRDNYAFQSVKITPNPEGSWIKFTIEESGEGHVSVIQPNPRKFNKSQGYQVLDQLLEIYDSNQNSLFNTRLDGFPVFDWDYNFEPGTYYVKVTL